MPGMTLDMDPWKVVDPSEFRARQDGVRRLAAERGLDGVVVFSRGGAFMDMSHDVLYLANHYSQQPYMGDEAGIGTARSHGVCIVPVEGPVRVVVDIPWWRPDLVVADEITTTIHVIKGTAAALREAGLAKGRVGLVGASYMTAASYLGLVADLPDIELVREDHLVEQLRVDKSPAELKLIREACKLGNRTVDALMEAAVEGATEAEAVAEAARVLIRGGGVLYDAACGSGPWADQFTYNRLPSADSTRRLEKGDMFHVDCYGSLAGYMFDFGRSRVVGDEPTPAQAQLIESTIDCVETICAAIRPGVTAGEAYDVCEQWLRESPLPAWTTDEDPEMESFPAAGHGLGMMWEPPWLMPGDPTVLEPGMYLAVEMLLAHPEGDAASFEHNGLVTEDGFEILTTGRSRWH
jgi:Xaa-Pro aminopeptidase